MTLPATLSLNDASSIRWDSVVIGAGVAGSIAARELSRLGCRTLLIDKQAIPRAKVCGCCLNATALRFLSEIGLSEVVDSLNGSELKRLALHCVDRRVDLTLPAGKCISRGALDAALVQAAIDSGAEFLPETSAAISVQGQSSAVRNVRLDQSGREMPVSSHTVVLATGLGSQEVSRNREWTVHAASPGRVGMGCILDVASPEFSAGTIWMGVGLTGYVGLVRLEDGRLNIAAAVDRQSLKSAQSPASAVAQILLEAKLPVPESLMDGKWHGTVSLTRHVTPLASNRVFLIGDAAGYVEPFTGEGMAWAMMSGHQVAEWVCRSLETWSPQIVAGWTRDYRRLVGRGQRTCRALSYVLHNPRLQKLSMGLVTQWPALARFAMSR